MRMSPCVKSEPGPHAGPQHTCEEQGLGFRNTPARSRQHTWEGCRESRRCSRDTYPEFYITK